MTLLTSSFWPVSFLKKGVESNKTGNRLGSAKFLQPRRGYARNLSSTPSLQRIRLDSILVAYPIHVGGLSASLTSQSLGLAWLRQEPPNNGKNVVTNSTVHLNQCLANLIGQGLKMELGGAGRSLGPHRSNVPSQETKLIIDSAKTKNAVL